MNAADADDPESRRLCRLPNVLPGQRVEVENQLADRSPTPHPSLVIIPAQPVQVQVDVEGLTQEGANLIIYFIVPSIVCTSLGTVMKFLRRWGPASIPHETFLREA